MTDLYLIMIGFLLTMSLGFPGGKEPACQCIKHKRQSLGRKDPLEEGMETHSSIPAWRIPWTEEPGGLQSTGSKESDTTERLS